MNLKDIERHDGQFARKEAFVYAILDQRGNYLGCFYIKPIKAKTDDSLRKRLFDAHLYFWIRTMPDQFSVDGAVNKLLLEWITESWPFKKPTFPGRSISWADWEKSAHAVDFDPKFTFDYST